MPVQYIMQECSASMVHHRGRGVVYRLAVSSGDSNGNLVSGCDRFSILISGISAADKVYLAGVLCCDAIATSHGRVPHRIC